MKQPNILPTIVGEKKKKEKIDIESEIEEDFSFDIEEESFRVVITAYYEDAGSNDYFYKVVVE